MYIVKNALKSISRSKGRNILIGIIVLVIAVSACIGLSIRQAAESAKAESLANMSVTASLSFDRQSLMEDMQQGGQFDPSQFAASMGEISSLSLEELQTYATAESVSDFTYSATLSLNGAEGFNAVSSTAEEEDTQADSAGGEEEFGMPGGGFGGAGINSGDFTLTGYSSESAMTSFLDGTSSITEGSIFEEGTTDFDCILSEELAIYNNLSVGDSITLENPANSEESYTLTIVGLYTGGETATADGMGMNFPGASDPANQIYTSYAALHAITEESQALGNVAVDEESEEETDTALAENLTGSYVFADVEACERFEEEARALGLPDSYTVASGDIMAFENSIAPLETLSTMAGYFLVVVLLIGAVILIVLSIFNIRERKYEVGVLTAIGMKKGKVMLQFLTETFVVTILAVLLGAGIGAVSSVPVTNALLESQVASQQAAQSQTQTAFGRGAQEGAEGMEMPAGNRGGMMGGFFGSADTDYVTEVSSAMDLTVMAQLLGIGILLTVVAGAVSMLFVMRYEPLKILANRD